MAIPVSVTGVVATDPRLAKTNSGHSVCSFRLAHSERRYDRDSNQWVDGDTDWFSVSAFRSLADNAHTSISKGDRILVSGKLRMRSWEKDGRQGMSADIEAEALGPELRWGTSSFTKKAPATESANTESTNTASTNIESASSENPVAEHTERAA